MKNYPKVEGNKRISNKTKPQYKAAVLEVHTMLTRESFRKSETICESLSVVKGMFNRILREDRDDWQAVNRRFGGVPKEEIKPISNALRLLRRSIEDQKKNQVEKYTKKLKETNIVQYLTTYLLCVYAIKESDHQEPSKAASSSKKMQISQDNATKIHKKESRQGADNLPKKPASIPLTRKDRLEKESVFPTTMSSNVHRENVGNSEISAIWIYRDRHPCKRHLEMMETVTAEVSSVRDNRKYTITVIYCKKCNKYYINAESLNLYAMRYGLPAIQLNVVSEGSGEGYQNWKDESILHILGYNVGVNDALPPSRRQRILAEAMDAGAISKVEVINFLEGLIARNRHRKNFNQAISKWNRDLTFVLDYRVNKQRKVHGRLISRK